MAQLSLLGVPLLMLVGAIALQHQQGPYWLGQNLDPEYAYLLNALAVALGQTPLHTDHPGTPVQVLGAVVIRLVYLGQGLAGGTSDPLTETVLQQPEFFLQGINWVLLLLAVITILGLGWLTLKLTGNLLLSLLLQTTPFLTLTNFTALVRVAPEPLLFSLCQGMVLLLVALRVQPALALTRWFPLALGGLLGLGVATKVTVLPLILFGLLLPTLRQKGLFLVGLVGAGVGGTLPIVSQYPRVVGWLVAIASRTGPYGTGSQGAIATNTLGRDLWTLVSQEPAFFVFIIGSSLLYTLLLSQRQLLPQPDQRRDLQMLGLGLLISWLQVLLALKQPFPRYLLPAMALGGLLLFLQVQLLGELFTHKGLKKLGQAIPWVLVGFCFILNTAQINHAFQQAGQSYAAVQTLQTSIQRNYANCLQFSYYRASSVEYGLKFGNDVMAGRFSEPLQKLYPQAAFYNVWARQFETYNQRLLLPPDLPQRTCLTLRGSSFDGENAAFRPAMELQQLVPSQAETLYQIVRLP